MYQAFFLFAFLAFTAGAPYGDVNSQRSFSTMQEKSVGQQPSFQNTNLQQDDDNQLVDSLGGGYSFFKKQPIVARPLIQQKLAINEQQAPITSFSDTADQWSDYTRASAFKHQPKTHIMSVNKNLIKDQGAYGSGLSQEQPLIRDAPSSYGQQDFQPIVTPKSNDAYGQQDTRTFVQPQQQLIRDDSSSYGQQQDLQQSWTPKSNSGYGQQDVRTLVQQQPLIRDDSSSSYGQQQDLQQSWTPKSNSGYGQQDIRTLVQQQPLIRDAPQSSYSQQDLQQPWAPKSTSGYGQNIQQKALAPTAQPSWSFQQAELPQQSSSMISSRTFSQQQPIMQKSGSGSYGGW